MGRLLKYLGYTLVLPFWWLQLLVPRNKHIWVFGAWYGTRFSDNSRYLFEYLNNHHKEIDAIWITKNKIVCNYLNGIGLKCFLSNSILGSYYCLRANYVIVSSVKKDVNALCINGATTVQLWHGNPMKKIGLDDKHSESNSFMYQYIVRHLFTMGYEFNYNFVVSNAPIFTDKMASAFGLSKERILETGCPRNDIFFAKDLASVNHEIRSKFKDCTLIYYLPTFRNKGQKQSMFDLEHYSEGKLQEFLLEENMVLVDKAHFATKPWKNGDSSNDRIYHLPNDDLIDINFLLKDADILITDYSGAYFDFLLTERPIIFAAFDLEQYISASRELYFEYDTVVSGPIVKNWEELFLTLRAIYDSNYKDFVKEKNAIFNKYHDDGNSKRVWQAITNQDI